MAQTLRPPEHLTPFHDREHFDNGRHPSLNEWLRYQAIGSEGLSARTYVICPADEPALVVGYYAISAALVERSELPAAKLRRGMPSNVPVLLIGRLAVDRRWQGRGLGRGLLVDAVRHCVDISRMAGVRAIMAHAIDEEAVAFYLEYGFIRSPAGERAMLLPIETAAQLIEASSKR